MEMISSTTRAEFREVLSGEFFVRDIDTFFGGAGFKPIEVVNPSVSGVRRSLVEQYYADIDFTSPSDTEKVLGVFGDIVFRLYMDHKKAVAERLERYMSRDGYRHENGHFAGENEVTRAVESADRTDQSQAVEMARNRRNVFVVHGRNEPARRAIFDQLTAFGLRPIEWSQAVQYTNSPTPSIVDILDAAMEYAQAIVVLCTPDDEARLLERYSKPDDPGYESELRGQARQNVTWEGGMAYGRYRERTVIVQIGSLRPMSDTAGLHALRFDGSVECRKDFGDRLESTGCRVDRSGAHWLSVGDWASVKASLREDVQLSSSSENESHQKADEVARLSEDSKAPAEDESQDAALMAQATVLLRVRQLLHTRGQRHLSDLLVSASLEWEFDDWGNKFPIIYAAVADYELLKRLSGSEQGEIVDAWRTIMPDGIASLNYRLDTNSLADIDVSAEYVDIDDLPF